ncbi:MAG: NADH-quinone oxidoreductase subunit J [Deltaproteobacteria bacterium]|nr:NADH-quinone oxidoreductase subunit J [Deltaproteobacteria bacterium]
MMLSSGGRALRLAWRLAQGACGGRGPALAFVLLAVAAGTAGAAEPEPSPGGLGALVAAGDAPVVVAATASTSPSDSGAPLVEQYKEGGGIRRQSSRTHVVLFWVGAVAALLGAIAVIVARRPMRSALGLLVVVLATAGLYLLLRAELLAALQVLIYAGAVVVLLVFVITFLDQGAVTAPGGRRLPVRILAVAAVVYVLYLAARELFAMGLGSRIPPAADFGSTASVGQALFTTFVIPFEAVSALLLTAIVGAVAVAKGRAGGASASAGGAPGGAGAGPVAGPGGPAGASAGGHGEGGE